MSISNLGRLYELSTANYIKEFDKYMANHSDIINSLKCDLYSNALGHSDERHIDLTNEEMIKRMLHDGTLCSIFLDENTVNAKVLTALQKLKTDIAEWFLKGKGEKFSRTIMCKDIIGKGIDYTFEGRDTKLITTVLKRSHDRNSDLGFYIATIYPNIKVLKENAVEMNGYNYRALAEEINGKPFTRNEDLIRAIKNETFPDRDIRMQAYDLKDGRTVKVKLVDGKNPRDVALNIYIKPDCIRYETIHNGIINRNICYGDIGFQFPQYSRTVNHLLNTIDKVDIMREREQLDKDNEIEFENKNEMLSYDEEYI